MVCPYRKSLNVATVASCLLSCLVLVAVFKVKGVCAQSIVPAIDGTGTQIAPSTASNQIDINGGTRSGANLFHSFQKFGLNQNEVANFISTPGIQNILSRVVGGEASIINGRIQVTGASSNLYLMNPAGILFGANASLNVPAAFIATTANGIGFGGIEALEWFNASGANDYTKLNSIPSTFAFTMPQPGAIVNTGNLSVGAGQQLMLLAGTIFSTQPFNAPEAKITVIAVSGESLVRLNQPGSLLSLEIQPIENAPNKPSNWPLPIATLPQLLTGGTGGNATDLTVNSDGSVQLTGSGLSVATGKVTIISQAGTGCNFGDWQCSVAFTGMPGETTPDPFVSVDAFLVNSPLPTYVGRIMTLEEPYYFNSMGERIERLPMDSLLTIIPGWVLFNSSTEAVNKTIESSPFDEGGASLNSTHLPRPTYNFMDDTTGGSVSNIASSHASQLVDGEGINSEGSNSASFYQVSEDLNSTLSLFSTANSVDADTTSSSVSSTASPQASQLVNSEEVNSGGINPAPYQFGEDLDSTPSLFSTDSSVDVDATNSSVGNTVSPHSSQNVNREQSASKSGDHLCKQLTQNSKISTILTMQKNTPCGRSNQKPSSLNNILQIIDGGVFYPDR